CGLAMLFVAACARTSGKRETVLTFSGSALGAEGTLVAKQLQRFMRLNPGIRVELQRTPDDASQRHQLYVQWLNARVGNPSILQLDVVWTPEFAAAGWVLPLDVLTWHEEEARFAFQNGNAVFMRNWPYPVAAMSDTAQSKVAGKFAVSPMPASGTAPAGHSTAALGGAQLAINAYTEFPDAA